MMNMKNGISLRKIVFTTALFLSFFYSNAQLQCDNDTTGLKSLIDLKTGLYLGYQGGLYPYGSNSMPYPHFSSGMNVSKQVLPLDSNGMVDLLDGKVGFICLGASTAGNAFNHFKSVAENDPTVNPCLRFVNAAVGAKGLEIMTDTIVNDWYWDDDVMDDVYDANITRYQVQVVWIMVTSRDDSILLWPMQPRVVADKYELLMPILIAKFPNLKEVFVSGFNYGGYADPTKEFYEMIYEPSSYWNNWSVKWLIERQINADPDLKFTTPGRRSPWIGWGPHLWADGLRANFADGLRWNCLVDFKPDGGGYHLSNTGKDKEGELIYDFFKNSTVAADWFRYGARWTSCDPDLRMSEINSSGNAETLIFPNPSNGTSYLEIKNIGSNSIEIFIYNAVGQLVYYSREQSFGDYHIAELKLTGASPGLYNCKIKAGDQQIDLSFVIQ